MNTKPAPQLLHVTQPSKSQVTFCQHTPKDLSRWLADLPKANIGETAKRLYQALLELNELVVSNEVRLSLLELIRPEVFAICRNLERYFLGHSIVLDERARKIANLCQALQNHLAAGYKYIAITELRSPHAQIQTILAQALQRALYSIYQILTRTSRLYHPVADGLWLELHQLYQVAHRQGINQLPINEPQAHGQPSLSIAQTYLLSQLLGCAQTNQIRQNDIARLSEVLERWISMVTLSDGVNEDSLFVIYPNQDKSPRYRSLGVFKETSQLLSINTQPLTDAIEQYLLVPNAQQPALYVPEYFSQDLLRHLAAAWSEVAERTFQRTAQDGQMHVRLGMSAVHYECAGKRAFDEVISHKKAAPLQYKEQERIDIWANAIDAQGDTLSAHIEYEEIPFSPKQAAAAEPAQPVYPSYKLSIINVSPSGYCLAWTGEVPSQLQTGEIVGLSEFPGDSCVIGMVRWVRQARGGTTQMGVEILAPRAEPCGLKLIRNSAQESVYLRALLLPAVQAISRPATLITPRLPFQESSKVMLNVEGNETKALLGQRLLATASFSHFQFHRIEPKAVFMDTPSKTILSDDFDSLWTTL